jgi:Glycosyl transferase family 11
MLKVTRKLGFRSSALRLARKGETIHEKHFHFDPEVLTAPKFSYLNGYWQTEKYFPAVSDRLRQEFQFRYLQDSKSRMLSDLIGQTSSVGLHIRRGDYLSNSANLEFHGLCGLDYFEQAIRQIGDRVNQPYFFIFSDEPEWARENLKLSYPTTIVDHNCGDHDYQDLRLMSQCQHQVIANSSFSWWAAWLNENPDKVVIAPSRWFNNAAIDTKDLIPSSWTRI